MIHQAILLPGIVLPAELAYPALIEALGAGVEARAKELEVYAGEEPPGDYGLETSSRGSCARPRQRGSSASTWSATQAGARFRRRSRLATRTGC